MSKCFSCWKDLAHGVDTTFFCKACWIAAGENYPPPLLYRDGLHGSGRGTSLAAACTLSFSYEGPCTALHTEAITQAAGEGSPKG